MNEPIRQLQMEISEYDLVNSSTLGPRYVFASRSMELLCKLLGVPFGTLKILYYEDTTAKVCGLKLSVDPAHVARLTQHMEEGQSE